MRLLFALLALIAARPALAGDGEYLFDVLKKPAFRAAWSRMVAGEKALPDWARDGAGVATPGVVVNVDGAEYEFHHLCKPHDCAGNALEAMFALGGGKVWGYLIETGKAPRYLGAPDAPKKIALERALKG